MKILPAILLTFLAAGLVSAQPYGSYSGFGNVVFPGLGHQPVGGNPWGNVVFPGGGQGFAGNLGGIVSGFRPYNGSEGGGGHRRNNASGIYAYPVFVGGYGYGGGPDPGAQPPAPSPNTTVVVPPAQQQQPVIINQFFGSAGPGPDQGQASDNGSDANVHVYRAPANDSGDSTSAPDTSYYLIAFKDHSIYSAVAYYVEGDTLHYFTSGNVHNQVSLALVDRPLTEQLNHERNVDVKLSQ